MGLRIAWLLAAGMLAAPTYGQVAFRAAASASAAVAGTSTITHIGSGAEADRDNCGAVTPAVPGGNSGDLLIATVLSMESSSTLAFSGTWTPLYADTFPGQDLKVFVYYRFASGTDGFTVNQTANCNSLAAQVARFRGVDPAQPFHNVPVPAANVARQNSDVIDTGTEAAAGANDMMAVVSFVNDDRTVAQGAGWGESFDSALNMGRDGAMALHYRLGGPNAVANWDLSGNGNDRNYGIIFALRPQSLGALTINVPAGTLTNDVMIASVAVRPCSNTNGAACTLTAAAPAGWTLIRAVDQTGGAGTGGFGNRLFVYRRTASATEPASYTWSFGGTPDHEGAAGAILSFSGVDTSNPIVAEAGQVTAGAFTHATPGIDTGTQTDTLLVSTHSANSAATWTAPGGMTERVDIASLGVPDTLGLSLEVNTQDFSTAGATGTRTATHSNPPASDTGATHLLALRPLRPVLQWTMDQSSWSGTAGEVLDASGSGLHGVSSGANTGSATPALSGNPGSCQYGSFDGTDDYLEVASNALLNITDELTVLVWIRPSALPAAGGLKTILSKDQNYEFHLNAAGRINWWWGGAPAELTSTGTVPVNAWTHVAIVYSRSGGFQRIYLNGAQDASTNNQTAALVANALPLQIGSDQGFAGRQFAGLIDEVMVFRSALSASAIQALMNQTRPCAASVDHLSIGHAGSGVACADQTITLTAHSSTHAAVDAGGITVNLSTTNSRGTWTGIVAGGGLLSDPTPGDGAASYTFAAGSSQVSLSFRYANLAATSETFGFNAVSGLLSTASGTGNLSDDPTFTLAEAGFVFTAIPTQLSGKPSNTGFNAAALRVQAVRTDAKTGSCSALFASQARTVQLGAECEDPAACAGQQLSVNGTPIATSNDNGGTGAAAYTGVPLTFDATSQAATLVSYPAAGRLSLHARYDLDASVAGFEMVGASNAFVVRPFGLRISGVTTSAAPAPTEPVFTRAGQDFNVTLTAVQWKAGDDANADGVPDSDGQIATNAAALNFGQETAPASASLSHTLNAPAGGSAGTLGGATTFTGFVAGAKTQAVNWSEVGFVNLFAGAPYLGVGNITNSAAGLAGVGRFRPDHFFVSASTLTNRAALACASAFSYLDEGIGLGFTLQARNAAAAPVVTQNYGTTSGYARLNPALITQLQLGVNGTGPGGVNTNLTTRLDLAAGSLGSFVSGQAAVSTTIAVERATPDNPDGPYTAVRFGTAPVDSDGVALRAADMNLDIDGAGGNDHAQVGPDTELRFGRLRMENPVGSEKLALPIQLQAQYWTGAAFARNTLDNCTAVARQHFALGSYTGNLNACESVVSAASITLSGGQATVNLSAPCTGVPCTGNDGSVLLTLNLATAPSGNRCDAVGGAGPAATSAVFNYLLGRWDDGVDADANGNTSYDDNPRSRAAFGLYGLPQPNNFIYFRENY